MLNINSKFKHSFDKPAEYKEYAELQYIFAHEVIKEFNFNVKHKILDIGCGDGKITYDMANMVPQGMVIGTDISEEMIAFAKKTYKKNNLQFQIMDAENNLFLKKFDIITSFSCLQWVPNQMKALRGIKKALVPNGKIILLLPLKFELETITESISLSPKWKTYFEKFSDPKLYFSLEQYKNLLIKVGFINPRVEKKTFTYYFNTQKDLEGWCEACSPHLKKIPKSIQAEFVQDTVEEFLSNNNLKDCNIPLPVEALLVSANNVN